MLLPAAPPGATWTGHLEDRSGLRLLPADPGDWASRLALEVLPGHQALGWAGVDTQGTRVAGSVVLGGGAGSGWPGLCGASG